MNLPKLFLSSCMLVFFVVLSGCAPSYDPTAINAWVMTQKSNLAPDGYILQPADTIEVLASKVPELHLQKQIIRPDGKISFEGIGEVRAAGTTPSQLAEDIRLKLIQFYQLKSIYTDIKISFSPDSHEVNLSLLSDLRN